MVPGAIAWTGWSPLALCQPQALGWVLFNILGPLNNQLAKMTDENEGKRRSVAAAVGLGAAASLLLAESADAATELSQLAAGSDGRVGIIATLFVPVSGPRAH